MNASASPYDPIVAIGINMVYIVFCQQFRLPFICRRGKPVDQKLPDELKGLGGSC
jgi:hypothetical protein